MIDKLLINKRVTIGTKESKVTASVKIYVVDNLLLSSNEEVTQAISRNPNPDRPYFLRQTLSTLRDEIRYLSDEKNDDEEIIFTSSPSSVVVPANEVKADADINVEEILNSAYKVIESKLNKWTGNTLPTYQIVSHSAMKIAGSFKHRLVLEFDSETILMISSTKQPPLNRGYLAIDVNDEEVQKMAKFAVKKLEMIYDETFKSLKVKLASFKKLTEMWKYKMLVEIVSQSPELMTCNVVVDKVFITAKHEHINDENEETVNKKPILSEVSCKIEKSKPIGSTNTWDPVADANIGRKADGGYHAINVNNEHL